MNTPSPFAALRPEIATLVEAGQTEERAGNRKQARSNFERAIRMLRRDEGEFVPAMIRRIPRSRTYAEEPAHSYLPGRIVRG